MAEDKEDGRRYSFEEYKLFIESADKVTDRRHSTNTWNYSLCTAILVANAALATWASSRLDFRLIMLAAIIILSGMGALLCVLWADQIRENKILNNYKFTIINEMAPRVRFAPDDDFLISAQPFAREWAMVNDGKKNTAEVTSMKIIAFQSSNAELAVPWAFRWIFILILVIALAVIVVNWTSLTSTIFEFKPVSNPLPNVPTTSGKPG